MTASFHSPLVGIVGWKNAGKTTLAVRLVQELTARGLQVSTIKHAHHELRLDEDGTDSARHRAAGARQVAVVSQKRWAILSELAEPDFADVVAMLAPADLIVVEGYKSQPIEKIEARRTGSGAGPQGSSTLSAVDPNVIAIAADHAVTDTALPVFDLNDVTTIADFVTSRYALTPRRTAR